MPHADSKLVSNLINKLGCMPVVESKPPPRAKPWVKDVVCHNRILQNRRRHTRAHLSPVLGNERNQCPSGQDVGMCNVLPLHFKCPRCHWGQTHDCVHQLELAVPLDAGHSHDLAGTHFDGHIMQSCAMLGVAAIQPSRTEDDLSGFLRLAPRCEQDLSAHHLPSQILLRELRRSGRTDDLATPHDGHPIAQGQDLVQPMRYEDDRVSFVPETCQFGKQLGDLLRRQNRCRLVQNKHGDIPVEQFEDLDLLACSYRDVSYQRIRVQVELKLLDLLAHRFTRLINIDYPESTDGLGAQNDVLPHRVLGNEQDLLVHHTYPGSNRFTWRPEVDLGTPVENVPCVSALEAIEHLHKRALPGSVLSDQRVDLAGFKRYRYVRERDGVRGEHLGDVPQVDQDVTCHKQLVLLVLGDGERTVDNLLTDCADAIDNALREDLHRRLGYQIDSTSLQTVLYDLTRFVGAVLDRLVDIFDGLADVLDVRRNDVAGLDVVLIRVDADCVQATLLGCLEHAQTGGSGNLEDNVALLVIEAESSLLAFGRIIPDTGEHDTLDLDGLVDVVDAILISLHKSHHDRIIRRGDDADDLVGIDILDVHICSCKTGTDAREERTLFFDVLDGGYRALAVLHNRVDVDEDLVWILVSHRLQVVLERIGNDEHDVTILCGCFEARLVLACIEVALDRPRLHTILCLDVVNTFLTRIVERIVAKSSIDEVDDLVSLGTSHCRLTAGKRHADDHKREQHTQHSLHVDFSPLSFKSAALGDGLPCTALPQETQ